MTDLIPFILVASIFWMGVIGRMHGGGYPRLPWGLDAIILPLPYLLFWQFLGPWVLLGYAGAILALRTGHGRLWEYDLAFKIGSEPEKIEYIIPDSWPVRVQKMVGMFLTGMGVTLVLGVSLALHGHIISGIVLLASGGLKAVAYFARRTESAELIRGSFLGLGFALAYYLLPA